MEFSKFELERFVPESLRILQYKDSDEHPRTEELRTVQSYLDSSYSREIAQKITLPMAYLSYDDASQACLLFDAALKSGLNEEQYKNIYGTHVEELVSEQSEDIYLPFLRVKTNPGDMVQIQDIENFLGGNSKFNYFDYEKYGTGRIQVDYNGKLSLALFTGPNKLCLTTPGTAWYLSSRGKIGVYSNE